MRSLFIRKAFAAFCAVIFLTPTFFLAFWYEGLHNKAYAQGAIAGGVTGAAKCGAMILISAGSGAAAPGAAAQAVLSVPTFDLVQQVFQGGIIVKEGFLDCLARAIAKAMLRAITKSIVDWANSGFNGNPSFVQDLRGFMLGVADETIGEFIAGSPLSFLCSPFEFRIRIAIARKFARRDAPLCTLSQIVGNIQGFTNNFSQGGWPAFLEFTVAANNNPFGGHLLAEAILSGQVIQEQGRRQFDLSLGSGFFSVKEKYNCRLEPGLGGDPVEKCDERSTTPGTVIETQLENTLGGNLRELELAKSFDEIIDALISNLLLNVFYGGLSNFGGSSSSHGSNIIFDDRTFGGGTSEEVSGAARGLVEQIDAAMQSEERTRNAKLQSLSAIEGAQSNLSSLSSCWQGKLTNSNVFLNSEQQIQARINAENATNTRQALEPRKGPLVQAVADKEKSIAALDTWRGRAFSVQTLRELDALSQEYLRAQAASSSTNGIFGVSAAEQELAQVREEMDTLNQSTDEKINQCHAFPVTQ